MDLILTSADRAFRTRIRAFLESHLPADIRRAQRLTTTVFAEYDIAQRWHRILHAQGWSAPAWPRDYGGPGWTIVERFLFQLESARAGAPGTSPIGLHLVGPVVMHFGTGAQKQWILPGIVSGEDYWCQGFSEPGAGSDLAGLRMKAVADGTDYILDGSKIWTTHAHFANWMIALVRTADSAKPQQGITMLAVDMRSPGISVRPILTIGGDHEVNQVFFDSVRVPKANRIGVEGDGWSCAKYLLEYERGGTIASAKLRSGLNEVLAFADLDDPDVAAKAAEVGIDIDALEMLELRLLSAMSSGKAPGADSSFLKLRASQLEQAVSELALQALGEGALAWESHRPLYDLPPGPEDTVRPVVSRYLNNRANTIFGGSSEIQKTIIARTILGL